jgi:DNA-binding SARP family transcriptional activator
MQIRLLGPVDVIVDGAPRPVRGLRRRAVLAVLALHRGDIVGTDLLADVIWAGDPPPTSRNTLQHHVSHLRHVLGSRDAIVPRPPGYLLDAGLVDTDVADAERLIRLGSGTPDRTHARQLHDALALWRGRPLSDFAGLPWLEKQGERLEQLRLRGNRALIETRLALGEHAQLLPELEALTGEHPFDEQLHAQLMLALYRTGRQARLAAVHPAHRPGRTVPGRGTGAGRRERAGRAGTVPVDRRQPVLRHRGAARRNGRGTGVGARRGAGARGTAER